MGIVIIPTPQGLLKDKMLRGQHRAGVQNWQLVWMAARTQEILDRTALCGLLGLFSVASCSFFYPSPSVVSFGEAKMTLLFP